MDTPGLAWWMLHEVPHIVRVYSNCGLRSSRLQVETDVVVIYVCVLVYQRLLLALIVSTAGTRTDDDDDARSGIGETAMR